MLLPTAGRRLQWEPMTPPPAQVLRPLHQEVSVLQKLLVPAVCMTLGLLLARPAAPQ
jgi:hypothetical protein